MAAAMSNTDMFDDRFLADGAENVPSVMRRAFIHGKESLLRDESETWYRAHLPSFAAIAAQLRREAELRPEDSRPHLELALHFDELALHSASLETSEGDSRS
jgi:hypothetical protein